MEFELKKYEKFKSNLMFMLVSNGVWPNFTAHSYNFKLLLSIFTGLGTGTTAYWIISFCFHNISNINVMASGLGLMFGISSAFIKLCIMRLHQDDLRYLHEKMLKQFESDLAIPENRPHLLAYTSTLVKLFYTFDYCAALTFIMLILAPLVGIVQGKYIRSYPLKLPFSYESDSLVHWSLYAFEVISAFQSWSMSVGADGCFGLYALQMVGEYRLLSSRFQNLKSSLNYKKDLKECVKRHVVLIKAHCKLQEIYGVLAILLAVTCAIIVCSIIYQAAQIKNLTIIRSGLFVFYTVFKMVQAYSFAWYGNIITVESESCIESIYNAFWPGSGDMRFMSDVLIILSQRPLIFTAKGFMYVRLDMFSKIAQTSLSYFFLLRTLEKTYS